MQRQVRVAAPVHERRERRVLDELEARIDVAQQIVQRSFEEHGHGTKATTVDGSTCEASGPGGPTPAVALSGGGSCRRRARAARRAAGRTGRCGPSGGGPTPPAGAAPPPGAPPRPARRGVAGWG